MSIPKKPRTCRVCKTVFQPHKTMQQVCGPECEFINIRESTTTIGIRRMASLIEYVQAWAAMNEVQMSDAAPERWAA